MNVAILVPVLARPHRVRPLLESIASATSEPYQLVFIADPDDREERDAITDAGAEMLTVDGGYAAKINTGVRATNAPLVFSGADDLNFYPGWLEHARAAIERGADVVGVNDLIPRGREHATHFLMTREYAQRPCIDGEPGPFSIAYHHWYCDDELIATAQHRNAYAYARDSVVEHLHPFGRADDGARKATWDATYERGAARKRLDRRTFLHRSCLWK